MGQINQPPKVKLFFACTYNGNFNINTFHSELTKKFGHISESSRVINFSEFTNYYEKEMGQNLFKQIFSIENLTNLDNLHEVKIYTNELEKLYALEDNRNLNIDPGYITPAKVLLFTTKNNIHRIYIKDGIYAEVTLFYKNNTYNPNPMTYKDYRQEVFINYFNELRQKLKHSLSNR